MSHKVVDKASQVRQGDLFRPDGVVGWRGVLSVETLPNVNGKEAIQVTMNGRTDDAPLVQFYGPDEQVEAMRPLLSPYIKELSA